MRVVPLFIAIALLGCVFAEQAPEVKAKRDLAATVQKAGDAMAKIQIKNPLGIRAMPQEAHLFKAQQSATCDQAAFADATARALQACPSLSGLVSGTTTLVEFLPGFCGSDCHKTLAAELPKHVACLDSMSSASFLLGFINGCALRPRCFGETFVKAQDSLSKRCSNQIDAVTNFKNFTTAALADTRAACQGTCVTEMASMMRTYPECIQDEDSNPLPAASMASLMEGLCQQENNEYCAVRMKGLGKLACSDYSVCYSSNSWCSSYYYSSCSPVITEERLYTFCGSCVANLQKNAAAFGDDADTVVSSLNLFCSTVSGGAHVNGSNPYCYPPAMNAISNLNYYTGLNYPANSTVASYCNGNASRCVDRIVSITADIATAAAKKSFVSCLGSYSAGSSYCLSNYESSLRTAADTRATGAVLCAQNDNNDWCLARLGVVNYYEYYCSWLSGSYRTSLESAINNAGCCMSYYNEYNRYDSSSYVASYLPAGTRVQPYTYYYTGTTRYYTYTHDSRYTRSMIYRNQQPANDVFSCLASTLNTTAFWSNVEGSCSTWLASPPTSSVPVMISWTRLNRNAAVKKAIALALRTDVANTIGVAAADILNFTLVENAAATIYLRNESTLTRRQAATTDHGATFQFAVDQPTATDATAAIARLTSAVSAGTFVTPSTSAAVQTQCGECVDARSDLLVKSAETPVAPVLTSPPNEASSARTVALASAIVAAFALVAAL